MERFRFDTHSLPVRIILGLIVVIVATLLAVGIPTLGLIRGELERQAQARVNQGANSTRAIYEARLREVQALTTLTAERPTLHRLIAQDDRAALHAYLETIRTAAHLDYLAVLNLSGGPVARANLPEGWDNVSLSPIAGTIQVAGASSPALAAQAAVPVRDEDGNPIGTVIGGIALNDALLSGLREETGLHQTLYGNGVRVATTLPAMPAQMTQVSPGLVWFDGAPFFVQPLVLESSAILTVDMLALPADELIATQTHVLQIIAASTLLVTILAAGVGYLLARRITAPLQRLVIASETIGRGELGTPIRSGDGVTEVMTLARTLERMRLGLRKAYEDLERSKAWSENLIASLAEGVLTVDANGRITSFSPGAERILGWRATDVIGRPYQSIFQAAPALNSDRGDVTRQIVSTRYGRQIILLTTSGAVTHREDGSWEQALVFRDVTEEEEALRLREFFLANVSHELKTPLSSLRASIELLAAERHSFTPEEETELVNSLWLGTIRLEELVDNLLSSASIRSGHFQVRTRPTDLESIVEEVMLTTRPLLALRRQSLELDIPSPPPLPPVWADPRRINQVLINLVSNASKYGPPDAPITIRVQRRAEHLVVSVIDQGPGIPPEVQSFLFQPFKRSDDAASGGVGLGLSIVKTIIERHGGEVGMNSSNDRITFWFTLSIVQELSNQSPLQTANVPAKINPRPTHENPGR